MINKLVFVKMENKIIISNEKITSTFIMRLLLLLTATLLTASTIANGLNLTGEHVCQQDERYFVNVTRNVQKNATERVYVWCLNFPPRCSTFKFKTYNVQQIQEEERIRKIAVCCDGYEPNSSGDKCLPKCDNCLNGICNEDHKCYCHPGYRGDHCERGCEFARWGRYCRYHCACERGDCDTKNGHCACPDGWTGSRCEQQCQDGHFGHLCMERCQCQDGEICNPSDGRCLSKDKTLSPVEVHDNNKTQTSKKFGIGTLNIRRPPSKKPIIVKTENTDVKNIIGVYLLTTTPSTENVENPTTTTNLRTENAVEYNEEMNRNEEHPSKVFEKSEKSHTARDDEDKEDEERRLITTLFQHNRNEEHPSKVFEKNEKSNSARDDGEEEDEERRLITTLFQHNQNEEHPSTVFEKSEKSHSARDDEEEEDEERRLITLFQHNRNEERPPKVFEKARKSSSEDLSAREDAAGEDIRSILAKGVRKGVETTTWKNIRVDLTREEEDKYAFIKKGVHKGAETTTWKNIRVDLTRKEEDKYAFIKKGVHKEAETTTWKNIRVDLTREEEDKYSFIKKVLQAVETATGDSSKAEEADEDALVDMMKRKVLVLGKNKSPPPLSSSPSSPSSSSSSSASSSSSYSPSSSSPSSSYSPSSPSSSANSLSSSSSQSPSSSSSSSSHSPSSPSSPSFSSSSSHSPSLSHSPSPSSSASSPPRSPSSSSSSSHPPSEGGSSSNFPSSSSSQSPSSPSSPSSHSPSSPSSSSVLEQLLKKKSSSVSSSSSILEDDVHFTFTRNALVGIISTALAIFVFLLGAGFYATARIREKVISEEKQQRKLVKMAEEENGGSKVYSFSAKSIFHFPLPDPPDHYNDNTIKRLDKNTTFKSFPEKSTKESTYKSTIDYLELFYDQPPSRGTYRAASAPQPPSPSLQPKEDEEITRVISEPIYDEIPSQSEENSRNPLYANSNQEEIITKF